MLRQCAFWRIVCSDSFYGRRVHEEVVCDSNVHRQRESHVGYRFTNQRCMRGCTRSTCRTRDIPVHIVTIGNSGVAGSSLCSWCFANDGGLDGDLQLCDGQALLDRSPTSTQSSGLASGPYVGGSLQTAANHPIFIAQGLSGLFLIAPT